MNLRTCKTTLSLFAALAVTAAACGSSTKSSTSTTAIAAATTAVTATTVTAITATATTAAASATTVAAATTRPANTSGGATTGAASSSVPVTIPTPSVPGSGGAGKITVFAASSLTKAFNEEGAAFTAANPGQTVAFSYGGSSTLVQQINAGAPADVFASADDANMKKLVAASENSGTPSQFARNSMEIIVATGNPKGIKTLADLANPSLDIVLCAPAVPCGAGAVAVLKNAGVTVTPKSQEQAVTGVVTKVTTGEADAGIVFVTDVSAATGKADGVAIPDAQNNISNYPIVVTKEARNPAGGASFTAFIESPAGQAILKKYGFLSPAS